MNHQWKLIKRRYIYKAKTLDEVSFVQDKVELPNGKQFDYSYVDCPYEVVYVVGVDKDHRISLIKQYRYIVNKDLLEIPAGSPDPGETLEEGAIREFEEETGFRPARIVKLGSFYPSVGLTNQIGHMFIALDLTKSIQRLEETEFIQVQWVKIEEALQLVKQGKIMGAGAAYGLFLVELWLKNNVDFNNGEMLSNTVD